MESDDSSKPADFKRKSHRVVCNQVALIRLGGDEVSGQCVDLDGRALAVELPLHTVLHGQEVKVNIPRFRGGKTLKVSGKVSRVDVFSSHLTGEDTLLIVCEFDELTPEMKQMIDDFLAEDTVDVASW